MMEKTFYIYAFLLFALCVSVKAQTNPTDSLKLKEKVNTEGEIRLNEDAVKAISFDPVYNNTPPPKPVEKTPQVHLEFDETLPKALSNEEIAKLNLEHTQSDVVVQTPQSVSISMPIEPEKPPTSRFLKFLNSLFTFDSEAIAGQLFSKTERAKAKNRKRVQNHKYY